MVNKFTLESSKNTETKKAITRTLEIANNYAGELSVEILSLDKIELDPENNRELSLTLHDAMHGIDDADPDYEKKKQDWRSLESLAKTIRDDQLINPIYVYRYGNMCRLIAGERRTLASAIAGKKEIIARIASQRPMGTKLKILQWIENNERVNLTLAERVASIDAIIKEYFIENKKTNAKNHITAKSLSELMGMSLTQARRYILILEAQPEIKKAIREGKLENIKLIELICSVENTEYQKQLLDSALTGLSFEALIKLKKEIENKRHIKKEIKGRKKVGINLGRIKPNIAKIVIDALVLSNILEQGITKKISLISDNIQWSNRESTEKSFKNIMSLIERGV